MKPDFEALLFLLQIGTICFGSLCVAMTGCLCIHFARSTRKIGKAVAVSLFGETLCNMIAVFFAVATHGPMEVLSPVECLLLRWITFTVAAVTSIHLAYRTWMIEVGADE